MKKSGAANCQDYNTAPKRVMGLVFQFAEVAISRQVFIGMHERIGRIHPVLV